MDTRLNWLLAASAFVYFLAGAALLFAPQEIAAFAGHAAGAGQAALLQVLGSALFGFAMLNWANRYSRTEGILGRPLVLANLAHAGSAALLLARVAFRPPQTAELVVPALVYAALAVAFGATLFRRS